MFSQHKIAVRRQIHIGSYFNDCIKQSVMNFFKQQNQIGQLGHLSNFEFSVVKQHKLFFMYLYCNVGFMQQDTRNENGLRLTPNNT